VLVAHEPVRGVAGRAAVTCRPAGRRALALGGEDARTFEGAPRGVRDVAAACGVRREARRIAGGTIEQIIARAP